MSEVVSGEALRKRLWPRTIVALALVGFAAGCETRSSTPIDSNATKNDPRSPRIKKRDRLHPEGTAKKTIPGPRPKG